MLVAAVVVAVTVLLALAGLVERGYLTGRRNVAARWTRSRALGYREEPPDEE